MEAAVLAGRGDEAQAGVEELADWTQHTADPLAPARLARCRALLAPPGEARERYEEALAHHEGVNDDFERARTQLLYGHWLLRSGAPIDSRGPLRGALLGFERCGATPWKERARCELRTMGEAMPVTAPEVALRGTPVRDLTPQQRRIARCVAEGASDQEVARRLSVATRTVDRDLREVFTALGVTSRGELAELFGRPTRNPVEP